MKSSAEQRESLIDSQSFEEFLKLQQERLTKSLSAWLQDPGEKVVEAARYSLLLNSKRLRPIFCLEASQAFCGRTDPALQAAMAVEMIHTYSLVHDDLPLMDDDDLRRGKPTNHKVYGEARALLAGDGLLTAAFEILSGDSELSDRQALGCIHALSGAAGMKGMVLGQDWDVDEERALESIEELEALHRRKTGALLSASVVMGGICGGADDRSIKALKGYSEDMGLAFQIHDDILDVEGGSEMGKTLGSDEKNGKATYVSLLGLEGAKREGKKWYESALRQLRSIEFSHQNRLEQLTRFVVERRV